MPTTKTINCRDCDKLIWTRGIRCKSCSRKGKLSWTKPHTLETKKKMSLLKKGLYNGSNNPNYGKGLFGDKNPNWRGGSAKSYYTSRFKKTLRPLVLKEFPACQLCGTKKRLTVHHIDHDKTNNGFFNLITLCLHCNIKAEWYNRKLTEDILHEYRTLHFLTGAIKYGL